MVNCKLYRWERVFMWNIRRELISGGFMEFTGVNTDQKWFKNYLLFREQVTQNIQEFTK